MSCSLAVPVGSTFPILWHDNAGVWKVEAAYFAPLSSGRPCVRLLFEMREAARATRRLLYRGLNETAEFHPLFRTLAFVRP